MKLKKRAFRSWLCLLLTAALLTGLLPYGGIRAQAEETKAGELRAEETDGVRGTADSILQLEQQEPAELDQYPEDVYGMGKNKPFLLSRQDELVILARSQLDNYTPNAEYYQMDNISMDVIKQESSNYILGGVNINTAEQFEKKTDSWATAYDDLQNPQSIGVDRNGAGRKEYIATVGKKGDYIYLYIQNAKSGAVQTYQLGQTWMGDLPLWRTDNHMAVTAGDYDGDGRDSIIVFVSGSGDNVCLWEFYPEQYGDSWSRTRILNFSSILKETTFTQADSSETWKPTVSLTTGDFNGDGREQLAFAAGYYDLGDTKTGFTGDADNLERFSTCVGIMSRNSQTWNMSPLQWMYDVASESTSYSGGEYTYPVQLMHGVVLAAGDVNNDGVDEIVAAGYTGYTPETHATAYPRAIYNNSRELIKVKSIGEFDTKYACSVIYQSGSGYARTAISRIDMPRAMAYTWTKYCNDKYKSFSKLSIACGRTSGNNAPADVFINGAIYQFDKMKPELKYTPAAFGESDLVHGGGLTDKLSYNNWIRNVAVGNFNGNDAGREQFVFTFWARDEDGYYTALAGSVSGVNYQDQKDNLGKITAYGNPANYGCSLTAEVIELAFYDLDDQFGPGYSDYWNYACKLSKIANSSVVFAVPVAVDIDNDGVIGRFNKSGYVYTDPEVLAVLEAGPYFSEISEAGGYEGSPETAYEISTSFGTGTSRSEGSSFEVGVAAEISGGPLKLSLEGGYTRDWSHSFETSYTVTQGSSFMAYSEDLVVVYRVPVLVYTYDILRENGTWIENGMTVRVPLKPCYYPLGIDEYNEFVDEYNTIMGSDYLYLMKKIVRGVDLPLDHEGNPDKYWRNWAAAGEGGTQLSAADYALGYSSGATESQFSAEMAVTESEEVSEGFHFGVTLQAGGNFVVGEAWAGGYYNMDFTESTGHSTTTVDTSGTSGTVPNIKASALGGLSAQEIKASYAFKWNFGKWERTLVQNSGKVPFYGYTVFGDNGSPVIRRAMPPEIENASGSAMEGYGTFSISDYTAGLDDVLTVTKLSGDSHITYNSASKRIRIGAGLAAGTYTAKFKISNGLTALDKTFTFTLTVAQAEPCAVKGCSLELEGKLGIRLRLTALETAKKAVLEFQGEFPETVEFDLVRDAAHGYNSSSGEFTLIYGKIAAKEMTCPLVLKVIAQDGSEMKLTQSTAIGKTQGKTYTACVADWAAYAAVNASGTDTRNLAKSLLNYGGAVQKYFSFNTANPANPKNYLKTQTQNVTPDAALNRVIPKDAYTKLGYTGMSLNLEGDTELQIKFSKKVTATLNGKSLTVKKSGTSYIVGIPGIAAVDLDKMMSVKVTYGSTTLTFKACALSWCNAAIAGSSNADLITMCKAMYLYNKYAEIYFNKVD